jgi:hypothetical protein
VLDINLPKTYQEVKNDIKRLLDPGLKHHNYKTDDLNKVILALVMHYYQILLSITYTEEIGEEELLKIDKIRKSYNEIHKVFYNQDIKKLTTLERVVREKDDVIQDQVQQIQAKDDVIQDQVQQIQAKDDVIQDQVQQAEDDVIQDQVQQIQAKDTHIRNIESELNLIKGSKVWRLAELFRKVIYK